MFEDPSSLFLPKLEDSALMPTCVYHPPIHQQCPEGGLRRAQGSAALPAWRCFVGAFFRPVSCWGPGFCEVSQETQGL